MRLKCIEAPHGNQHEVGQVFIPGKPNNWTFIYDMSDSEHWSYVDGYYIYHGFNPWGTPWQWKFVDLDGDHISQGSISNDLLNEFNKIMV